MDNSLSLNTFLPQLIAKSKVLTSKYNEQELQEFTDKVLNLPPEGKIKMLQALVAELEQDVEARGIVQQVKEYLTTELQKANTEFNK